MMAPTLKKALDVEGGEGRLAELKTRRMGRWSGAVVDAPQPRNIGHLESAHDGDCLNQQCLDVAARAGGVLMPPRRDIPYFCMGY